MDKQSIQDSKSRRTGSWKSQPDFDKLLAETETSGLRYLQTKYENQLYNYKSTHNLNKKDYFKEYKEIQQRYKMINDEMFHRINDIWASPTYRESVGLQLDSSKGLIWSKDGMPLYTVDFNEYESGFIVRDLEGIIIDDTNAGDNNNPKLSIKEMYDKWDYWLIEDE